MDPITIAFLATTAISAGLSFFGGQSAANAQEEAAQRNAEFKRMQARELMARQQINERIMREKAQRQAEDYSASFASTGLGGTGIGAMIRIKSDMEENIELTRREASTKATMLALGADADLQLGSDLATATRIGTWGSLIGNAGQAGMTYANYGKASSSSKGLDYSSSDSSSYGSKSNNFSAWWRD